MQDVGEIALMQDTWDIDPDDTGVDFDGGKMARPAGGKSGTERASRTADAPSAPRAASAHRDPDPDDDEDDGEVAEERVTDDQTAPKRITCIYCGYRPVHKRSRDTCAACDGV